MSIAKVSAGSAGQAPAVPKSVFITGANGFIGRALMQRYRALGCDVRGMDLKADAAWNVVAGNLIDPRTWAAYAKGSELFINTAAVVSLSAEWRLYRDVSVQGVRNALYVAIAAGAKRFVQYSSIAALGWAGTMPMAPTRKRRLSLASNIATALQKAPVNMSCMRRMRREKSNAPSCARAMSMARGRAHG